MPAKVAFLGPLLLTPSTPLHLIGGTPLYLHACNPGISLSPYDYLLFTVGVTPALIRAHLLWHIYVSPQNDPCNPRDPWEYEEIPVAVLFLRWSCKPFEDHCFLRKRLRSWS